MIVSLIIELFAILYLFLPREFCCERYEYLTAPFSGFALCITILLLYTTVTYAQRLLRKFLLTTDYKSFDVSTVKIRLGFSFYLCIVALLLAFFSFLVGVFNVTLAWCFLWR
ncbi:unnamed protein product [Gongylonema pulchrum]|uniref:Uncharacterized protein n=1 Tax=Gongylonema pulchrum TaxID=637853 RepID=A0A3P7RKK1_9BILA|nr:unnamed protein product [Gongylonema pulchrum]